MIHYSIIPLEVVMQDNKYNENNITRIIQYQGCQVEVSNVNGQAQIQRVFSSSPQDYLNPKLQPGLAVDNIN